MNDSERYRLMLGDCLERMREMPDGSIDAVITDPPFFCPATHYQTRVRHFRKWSDMTVLTHWWGMMCGEFFRILKPEGHCLTFCNADSFAAFYPAMFPYWERLTSLIWDKQHIGMGRVWRHQHELIIAARNSCAYELKNGRAQSDVIRCPVTPSADRDHPVQKPAAVLRLLVEATCPPDGTVLDPFMGSGTTGEGAILAGCQFIGIEQDPEYHAIATARLQKACCESEKFAFNDSPEGEPNPK
jgi:site-specific DNA-methyltransferase (adenine-specific)